jgi:subfamily B ATP-binding cassette protein MsbA
MDKRIGEARDQGFRTYLLSAVAGSITGLTAALAPMVVLWYGGLEIMAGRLTLGQFVAFNSFLAYLYKPAEGLVNVNLTIQRSLGAAVRIFEMMDTPGEESSTQPSTGAFELEGGIRFENLSFCYEQGRTVLDDICLEVQPGEAVAVVGPSGAGKTTLVNLIPRFYKPSAGRILVGGTDTADLPLRALREAIGMVAQEPFLFTGTVADNLRYGRKGATRDEIVEAARRSCAHDFIQRLPRGYETLIGERGARLSGGQRQRLAIARTLLKDPSILIFDEATSSLDGETEAAILKELRGLMTGKTTLIVSHRLSALSLADRIIFLKEGRIEAEGNHADLLQRSKIYRDLFGIKVRSVA